MPVLIEGISVVIRCDTLEKKYQGGLRQYIHDVPNITFCTDNEITRVGFMVPTDVGGYINNLKKHGLIFAEDGHFIDIAVVDMLHGFTAKCDWLEFKTTHSLEKEEHYSWCRLVGSCATEIFLPDGWDFETSLTKKHTFASNGEFEKEHKFLRAENGRDVWLNLKSGNEVFVGRAQKLSSKDN